MTASKIEWTDAVWNPVRGCSIVSKGCTNCYAMKQAHRFSGPGRAYEGLTIATKGGPVWTGKIRLVYENLDWPLLRTKPLRIFVNSMSDLFHEDVPDDFILEVFDVMRRCENGHSQYRAVPQHTFQILTKRPGRMLDFCRRLRFGQNDGRGMYLAQYSDHNGFNPMAALKHVWLGVSVEDQATADERIPLLEQTPCHVRWISAEPLLGPVKVRFDRWFPVASNEEVERDKPRTLDWLVTGGESGPGCRPSHPDWFRSLRDQCAAAGVPFFFKQWGAWAPDHCQGPDVWKHLAVDRARWNGEKFDIEPPNSGWPNQANLLFRLGKAAAGRELDGRFHDEYPA